MALKATLTLSFVPNSATQAEMDARYPECLQKTWQDMDFDDTLLTIHDAVNTELYHHCATNIAADVGGEIEDVETFSSGDWSDQGTFHEGDEPVRVSVKDVVDLVEWTFTSINGPKITVHANVVIPK